MRARWEVLLFFVCVFVLCMVSHFPSITGEFVFDDYTLILNSPLAGNLSLDTIKTLFTSEYFYNPSMPVCTVSGSSGSGYFRPFAVLAYAFLRLVLGLNPAGFHVFNIFLHSVNCLLVFVLASMTGFNRRVSMTAGILFACHPSFHQAIDYCTGLVDILAVFFALVSLVFIIRWKSEKHIWTSFAYPALVFYFFAILTKEMTALGFLLMLSSFRDDGSIRNRLLKSSFFLIPAAVAVLWRKFVVHLDVPIIPDIFTVQYLGSVAALLFVYLKYFIFPFNPAFMQQYMALNEDPIHIMFLFFVFVLSAGWIYTRYRSAGFLIFWAFLAWLPVSNIIPMHPGISDFAVYYSQHLIYYLSVPLVIGCARVIDTLRFRPVYYASVFLLIILFSFQTFTNSMFWADPERLYNTIISENPVNAYARNNLGVYYNMNGQYEKAAHVFETLIRELEQEKIDEPRMLAMYLNNLGFSYRKTGREAEASACYEKIGNLFHEKD